MQLPSHSHCHLISRRLTVYRECPNSLGCAKAHFVRQPWDIVALRRLVQSLLFFIIFVVPPIGSATNSNVLDVIVYFSGTGECAVGSGEWGARSEAGSVGSGECEVGSGDGEV